MMKRIVVEDMRRCTVDFFDMERNFCSRAIIVSEHTARSLQNKH